ncbi:ATP-binding protein [Parvibacter caecicola]|uniref:ATP-binding protein n=1 Tax=Parvibacter caecicola TaxID=747645 RepID=UPI002730AFF4|nr:ATP-binding protein [Parvibacter caecicola]
MAQGNLENFIADVMGDGHLRVEQDFGGGFVRLKTSEAERRQAVQDIRSSEDILIEVLRNSRDAGATRIFVATGKEGPRRCLQVIDDGAGIPAAMHQRVFEPRVTSKLESAHLDKWGMHGRGMALYSIAVNSQLAEITVSQPQMGTSLRVVTDTAVLGEKVDQSAFPVFEKQESGAYSMRGPKNLLRTAAEFALEHRGQVEVYLGSPAEVCATLYAYGLAAASPSERAFGRSEERPYVERLGFCADSGDFARVASQIGLEVSERTARRVMDGEVPPLPSLLTRLQSESFASKEKRPVSRAFRRDARRLKLESEDLAMLAQKAREAYRELAPRYFLNEEVEPSVAYGPQAITITIPIEKML